MSFSKKIFGSRESSKPTGPQAHPVPAGKQSGTFHEAAEDGDLEKVKALLKGNPRLVFRKDDEGQTPLHVAASKGHKDVAKLLMDYKADVNARKKYGDTPLHYAAHGHKDVVELLLANKADVNAKDNIGYTPLHEAARNGCKDVVELLLANKADVNAKVQHRRDAFVPGGGKWPQGRGGIAAGQQSRRQCKGRQGLDVFAQGGDSRPQGHGGIAAGQQSRRQCQGQQRGDAFAPGGGEWPQGRGGIAAGQQSRG